MTDNSMITQKKKRGRAKKLPGEVRYVPSKSIPEINEALKTCGLIVTKAKGIIETEGLLDAQQLANFKAATEILWRQRELVISQRRIRLQEKAFQHQVKLTDQTDNKPPPTDLSTKSTAELLKIIDAVVVNDTEKTNVKKK